MGLENIAQGFDIASQAGNAAVGLANTITGWARGINWQKRQADALASVDYKYQQKAADAQAARDREMWDYTFNEQNAYNDPSAMRKRLEDAGLSKASMFEGTLGSPAQGGDMTTGVPGSSYGSPAGPNAGLINSNAGTDMTAIAMDIAKINNMDAQSKLMAQQSATEAARQSWYAAQTANTFSRTAGQLIQNRLQSIYERYAAPLYQSKIGLNNANIRRYNQDILLSVEKLNSLRIQNEFDRKSFSMRLQMLAAQTAVGFANADFLRSGTKVNERQADLISQLIFNSALDGILKVGEVKFQPTKFRDMHLLNQSQIEVNNWKSKLYKREYKWMPVMNSIQIYKEAFNGASSLISSLAPLLMM